MKRVPNAAFHCGLALLLTGWLAVTGAGGAVQPHTNAAAAKAATSAKKSVVDVNSADAKTLETLPGIGPTLANRIIAGRPYRDLSDLGKVKGLSKSKLATLKDEVTFGPATASAKDTTSQQAAKKSKATKSATAADTNAPVATASATAKSGTAKSASTSPTPTGSASGKLAAGQKININTANAAELDRLPGIGPTRAQAIIDYRTQNGNFKTTEDIQKVKGIKAGEFSKIKDYIKVTD